MKRIALSWLWVVLAGGPLAGQEPAVPPPEKLLPSDTIAVLTVPDMMAARSRYQESPQMRIWHDPALQPFVEKLRTRFGDTVLAPLQEELGISLAELVDLAQGQVTLALTPGAWPSRSGARPTVVFLVDARDRASRLRELLALARAKLAANGMEPKSVPIAGTDFFVVLTPGPGTENSPAEDAAAPEGSETGAGGGRELYVGQVGALLVCGTDPIELEKVVRLRAGDAVLALAESTSFMADHESTFHAATAYGWVNLEPLLEMARQAAVGAGDSLPMGLNPGRILTAVGLNGLKTASFAATLREDGTATEVRLRMPEAERRGLLRMLSFEARDASPPAFVPAGVLSFSRNRMDLARAWNTLESMVVEISPQLGGLLRLTVDALGKDKDPNFDFRKQFVANLGNDIVTWQMAGQTGMPASGGVAQVALIQSPNPGELAASLKLLMGMVPSDVAKLEEHQMAGSQVWSIAIPMGLPSAEGAPPPTQTIAFAAARGYLAVATSSELLRGFLEAKPASHTLLETEGLRAAADQVGGLESGWFGFTNDRESIRSLWSALTGAGEPGGNATALALRQLLAASAMAGEGDGLQEWVDFSLLPPFEKIEKYFHYSVYAASSSPDGFTMKYFAPRPPGL